MVRIHLPPAESPLRTQFGQRRLADEIAAGPLGARHPRAAVLAERRHHFDLIQRQRAFRIVDETLAGRPRRAALWISIARICPVVCGLRPANPLLAISRVGLHIDLFEACSAFTRVAACTLARSPIVTAIRRLQPFRYLHDCSDRFRRERSPGGPHTHGKAPPYHGARRFQSLRRKRLCSSIRSATQSVERENLAGVEPISRIFRWPSAEACVDPKPRLRD